MSFMPHFRLSPSSDEHGDYFLLNQVTYDISDSMDFE